MPTPGSASRRWASPRCSPSPWTPRCCSPRCARPWRRSRSNPVARARPEQPYVYFILIRPRGGREQYLAGMRAGADDFLTKPVDADQLGARLTVAERILGLRRELQQLEGLLPICAYCKRIRDDQENW